VERVSSAFDFRSYANTAGTVTATLTENPDFTVTGTVDGMNFTEGSLVGGYVSMVNTMGVDSLRSE